MAAAGFWTTATDLALLVLELQQEYKGLSSTIADSSLIHEMLRPRINATGLGVHLKGYKDVAAFWDSGNNAGYTGLLFGTLDGQGAIVLSNSDNGIWLAQDVVHSIADAYGWSAMRTEYLKPTSGAAYDQFVGNYTKDASTQAAIGKDAKGLFLQPPGSRSHLTLYALRDGSFLIKEKPEHFRLFFDKDAEGKVKGLQYFQYCGTAQGSMRKLD
ncbi:hypothetical protein [Taibaiella koreensis]|uniref:hypothetical protein n=1 Tax=Taibaiella koreensis TaxID=1268548 RepID=UPI000E59D05F|nr:hypothetical protein [Taibaiella koreensis]